MRVSYLVISIFCQAKYLSLTILLKIYDSEANILLSPSEYKINFYRAKVNKYNQATCNEQILFLIKFFK